MITNAVFKEYERAGANSYRVRVALTDSVTGTREVWLSATGATAAQLHDDLSRQIAALIAADVQTDLLAGSIGTGIPITAPAVPAIDPDAAWLTNVRRAIRLKAAQDAGLTASATDLTALQASNNAGYTSARGLKL